MSNPSTEAIESLESVERTGEGWHGEEVAGSWEARQLDGSGPAAEWALYSWRR